MKKRKKKSLTKKNKKTKKTTHSTVPSISIQWCSVGDRGWRGPQKQKYNTLEGRMGVYCPWKLFLSSFRTGRTFMKHDFNLWERVLYKLKNENCARHKTKNSTQPVAPVCTNMHAVTWYTHFLTVQASEFAYMSLYIIYLYLVKNKLHNSTNSEKYFFKLKMS